MTEYIKSIDALRVQLSRSRERCNATVWLHV